MVHNLCGVRYAGVPHNQYSHQDGISDDDSHLDTLKARETLHNLCANDGLL